LSSTRTRKGTQAMIVPCAVLNKGRTSHIVGVPLDTSSAFCHSYAFTQLPRGNDNTVPSRLRVVCLACEVFTWLPQEAGWKSTRAWWDLVTVYRALSVLGLMYRLQGPLAGWGGRERRSSNHPPGPFIDTARAGQSVVCLACEVFTWLPQEAGWKSTRAWWDLVTDFAG
jgi:hypothetical protein